METLGSVIHNSWHVVFRGPKLKSVTWEREKAEEQGPSQLLSRDTAAPDPALRRQKNPKFKAGLSNVVNSRLAWVAEYIQTSLGYTARSRPACVM